VLRVLAIIDGLNLFHGLESQQAGSGFIDVAGLVRRLINRDRETLVGIEYYSSLATHLSEPRQIAQMTIHNSAERAGVNVALGSFKQLTLVCEKCHVRTHKYVEKQTDVSLALALVSGAYENTYDKVLLFSADTDLMPAIKLVKTKFPEKEVKLVSTVGYLRPVHATMGRLCDGQIRLTPELIGPQLIASKAE
jgi:uncharacterized LabA/DUF88 family protein